MNGPMHHDISIHSDGLGWHCSCGMHGKSLASKSTRAWAAEHVVDRRDTKTFRKGEK